MEVVIAIIFLLLFVGVGITNMILLITFQSNTKRRLGALMNALEHINDLIKRGGVPKTDTDVTEATQPSVTEPEPMKKETPVAPVIPTETIESKPVQPIESISPEPEPEPREEISVAAIETTPQEMRITPLKPPKKERPKTDWEKFFGEKLVVYAGIILLVLGIGFFVQLAVANNWINNVGRVAVGYLIGGLILGTAHALRNKFRAFSSVLVGGTMTVMYFTTAIAFHEYHIFSQTTAFILMVIITLGAIALSVSYNRKTIAVLALLGGFVTPYIVSSGTGNYIVLFSYLSILNIGLLLLSYFRKWRILHVLAFVFTATFYAVWIGGKYASMEVQPVMGALTYVTIFYLIFFAMGIISTLRSNARFDGLDIVIFILNSFLYYIAGLYLLDTVADGQYRGLFTAGVALINFIVANRLWKNITVSKNLVYLLLGLVMTFVSMIAPIQLNGSYITIFWAAEAAVLLWLWKQTGLKLTAIFSSIVTICMYISLLMDWEHFSSAVYFDTPPYSIAANPYFITGIMAALSLYMMARLLSPMSNEKVYWFIPAKTYRRVVWVLFHLVTYTVLFKEIDYQIHHYSQMIAVNETIIAAFTFLYMVMLSHFARKWTNVLFKAFMLFINIPMILVYLFTFSFAAGKVRTEFVTNGSHLGVFLTHYITVAATIWLLVWCARQIADFAKEKRIWNTLYLWFITFCAVFITSAELLNGMILLFSSTTTELALVRTRVIDAGFPILWGLGSVLLIILGIRLKKRVLRIISLSLIGVTLFKVGVTVAGMSQGVQVAAFIGLGVILLVIAFIYQKLNLFSSEIDERSE